jgi:soluble lytic murein transglycosylase-like protein
LIAPGSREGARPLVSRRLLGCGVLLLTMISGYMATRMTGAYEISHVTKGPAGLHFHIRKVAARYGVSEGLITAIIEAESGFNPRAVSRRGAMGLMQLMPATAAYLGVGDPFDPQENIDGGVRHLLSLMDRFDSNLALALAAYNAGERAVINYGGVPPYRQTRQYVRRILRRLDDTPRDRVGLVSKNRWIW